jgi:transposase
MGLAGLHLVDMRGDTEKQSALMVTVTPEELIPRDHPIRVIKGVADEALKRLGPQLSAIYSDRGRPSIPPEVLLKAQILIALYSVRSERLFCERLQYDFLFRWFLDLPGVGTAFDATTFTKNRERLLEADLFGEFFREVIEDARRSRLLSDEHFTVDGTLIEACASLKSFRPKGGDEPPKKGGSNPDVDFKGQKRSNQTHGSTTDPEAKLFRKGGGKPSQLCYIGHVLMENRNGLCTDALVSQANGRAEPEAALAMVRRSIDASRRRVTLGADKGYDIGEFQMALAEEGVHSHVAQKEGIRPVLDRRTTRRSGYRMSQRRRKRVEEIFGWAKTVAGMGKTRFRGAMRVGAQFLLAMTAYNLVRIARLQLQSG